MATVSLVNISLKNSNHSMKKESVLLLPEGLSRFYLEELQSTGRKSNRVGATWMTKEDRLTDIKNYMTFLDHVFKTEVGSSNIPVTVFGFSQGCATASRWILSPNIRFERLLLWAGVFPPDMDFQLGGEILRNKKVQIVYGTKDQFLNESRMDEMHSLIKKLNVSVEEISFDGGHDVDGETLLRIA
jgi:predicted esterase